jgi:hypothetical protein
VLVAFWLWWPLFFVQAIMLVLMIVAFVMSVVRLQTIADSGPGEGFVMIIVVPVGMVMLALLAVEIPHVFHLRSGRTMARVWLIVMAILNGLLAAGLVATTQPSQDRYVQGAASDGDTIITAVTASFVIGAALALVAAVLPFLRPANQYFSQPGAVPARTNPRRT